MNWIFIIFNIRPLYRQYRCYAETIRIKAAMIYARKRKRKHAIWAREYLTRHFLEKYDLTFWQWLQRTCKDQGPIKPAEDSEVTHGC